MKQLLASGKGMGSEAVLGGAVILMVVMLVVPLPSTLLSLLLALNLAIALLMLLVTMSTTEPLDFAVFPSLLLLTTLFRLALNVSTARLILLNGYAGQVIEAFGQFVVGGNPLVGFIVFLILVVIQFVVITKGSERVAEVAARFTLDAMPGKQMSIDADLNAGLIDDKEARKRRRDIEREADFYGAMDGASKFVKGDAMAGLLIVAINILGGFAIGMLQKGMAFSDALSRYTILTIGDGLSAQIPALLISTATGIIVTRAAAQNSLGKEVASQVLAEPRLLMVAGGSLVLIGLVPGLPKLPFLTVGIGLFWLGRIAARRQAEAPAAEAPAKGAAAGQHGAAGDAAAPAEGGDLLELDPLEIELGYGLLKLAEGPKGGELMRRVGMIRRQLAAELGLLLPLVRVRDNVQLPPNAYAIKLRGSEIARGELHPGQYLAMNPSGEAMDVHGTPTREPAFGLPAMWIVEGDKVRAELAGCTVVDAATVLATHFSEICKRHAHEILSRQECKALLDAMRARQAALVDELVPAVLSTGQVQRVLQNLLREGVSIRNLATILETLSDAGVLTKDADVLTERVRAALAREITRDLPAENGKLAVCTLDPKLESRLADPAGAAALEPDLLHAVRRSLATVMERFGAQARPPVVLTSPHVRAAFRRLIERVFPQVRVVSTAELAGDLEIESLGSIGAAS
ncbi:MAG TPA: flagellar biosynthesis protein FlhA [Bacillota bacterium]|nr:flagellar biosynthesis protein FlhA [Bacillota bacterium]